MTLAFGKDWLKEDAYTAPELLNKFGDDFEFSFYNTVISPTTAARLLLDAAEDAGKIASNVIMTIESYPPLINIVYLPKINYTVESNDAYYDYSNGLDVNLKKIKDVVLSKFINGQEDGYFAIPKEQLATCDSECHTKLLTLLSKKEQSEIKDCPYAVTEKKIVFYPFYQFTYNINGLPKVMQINALNGEVDMADRHDLFTESIIAERAELIRSRKRLLIIALILRLLFYGACVATAVFTVLNTLNFGMREAITGFLLIVSIYVWYVALDALAFKLRDCKKISVKRIIEILQNNSRILISISRLILCIVTYIVGIVCLFLLAFLVIHPYFTAETAAALQCFI